MRLPLFDRGMSAAFVLCAALFDAGSGLAATETVSFSFIEKGSGSWDVDAI